MRSTKKIVLMYTPTSYFGLGDYIRGIIHMLQNENSNNVFINYQTNDINEFVYNNYGNNAPYNNESCIYTDEKTYYNFIYKNSETVYLYHNAAIKYPIDKSILEKVKRMFTVKPEFQKVINDTLNKIVSNKPFHVLHIRLNDDVFVKDRELTDPILDTYIRNIKLLGIEIIVMSNSNNTKNKLCVKHDLKCINVQPAHTGAIGVKGDIKDTMLEFFIMSKSLKIHQYCEIVTQKSGFSQRISEIYDIPIERIIH